MLFFPTTKWLKWGLWNSENSDPWVSWKLKEPECHTSVVPLGYTVWWPWLVYVAQQLKAQALELDRLLTWINSDLIQNSKLIEFLILALPLINCATLGTRFTSLCFQLLLLLRWSNSRTHCRGLWGLAELVVKVGQSKYLINGECYGW